MPSMILRAIWLSGISGTRKRTIMSLPIEATWTPATKVLCFFSSLRSLFMRDQAAALEAQDATLSSMLDQPSAETTFTSAPPPFFASTGEKALDTFQIPQKFVSIRARAQSETPCQGVEVATISAHASLIRILTSEHCAATVLAELRSDTSRWMGMTAGKFKSPALYSASYALEAPSSRKASTNTRPNFRFAPVTRTTLPLIRIERTPQFKRRAT